jgi:hypothetical protein
MGGVFLLGVLLPSNHTFSAEDFLCPLCYNYTTKSLESQLELSSSIMQIIYDAVEMFMIATMQGCR